MQILVVVANIQVRSLRAEVEKGFARTAIGRKLVDPKPEINFEEGTIGARSPSGREVRRCGRRRGGPGFQGEREVGQNSDVWIRDRSGSAERPWRRRSAAREEFSFLANGVDGPGIASSGGRSGASKERFSV